MKHPEFIAELFLYVFAAADLNMMLQRCERRHSCNIPSLQKSSYRAALRSDVSVTPLQCHCGSPRTTVTLQPTQWLQEGWVPMNSQQAKGLQGHPSHPVAEGNSRPEPRPRRCLSAESLSSWWHSLSQKPASTTGHQTTQHITLTLTPMSPCTGGQFMENKIPSFGKREHISL